MQEDWGSERKTKFICHGFNTDGIRREVIISLEENNLLLTQSQINKYFASIEQGISMAYDALLTFVFTNNFLI